MKTKIYPHLWYAKDADQAAQFYASIFPDSKVERVWALPVESPSGPPGSVKIVDFVLFGQRFQAMTAGPHHDFNDAISLVVECADQAELDRYGVRWQIVPARWEEMMAETDQARAKRVADAMLKMVKLDIAALERAYRG